MIYNTDRPTYTIEQHQLRFEDIVSDARAFNLDTQASDSACVRRDWSSRRQYAEEFQTVRIDVGRCVGKTRYICEHATKCDVVITHSWEARNWYNTNSGAPVIPACLLTQQNAIFCPQAAVVFVDEVSLMSDREIDAIYERFSTAKVEQFVFLG